MTGRSVSELLSDYLDVLDQFGDRVAQMSDPEYALYERLVAYHKFVERDGHLLEKFTGELFTLLHNQPTDSAVRDPNGTLGANPRPNRPWMRRLNPPPTDPTPELVCTFDVGSPVDAVACWKWVANGTS